MKSSTQVKLTSFNIFLPTCPFTQERGEKKAQTEFPIDQRILCCVLVLRETRTYETVATYRVHETFPLFKCDVSFREREREIKIPTGVT